MNCSPVCVVDEAALMGFVEGTKHSFHISCVLVSRLGNTQIIPPLLIIRSGLDQVDTFYSSWRWSWLKLRDSLLWWARQRGLWRGRRPRGAFEPLPPELLAASASFELLALQSGRWWVTEHCCCDKGEYQTMTMNIRSRCWKCLLCPRWGWYSFFVVVWLLILVSLQICPSWYDFLCSMSFDLALNKWMIMRYVLDPKNRSFTENVWHRKENLYLHVKRVAYFTFLCSLGYEILFMWLKAIL